MDSVPRMVPFLLVLVLIAGTACAADYWVDAVSGSDVTGNGSRSTPWATITHALASMPAAGSTGVHTLHVNPGVYDTALGEQFPITVPTGVRLEGLAPSQSVIYGPVKAGTALLRFASGTDTRTEITRLGLHGGDPAVLVDAGIGAGAGPLVRLCRISNNATGIRLTAPTAGTRGPVVETCDLRANAVAGIQLLGAAPGILAGRVQDCWLDGNGTGIDVNGTSGDIRTSMLGCAVLGNTGDGVRFRGVSGSGVTISHATVRANGAAGLTFGAGSAATGLTVRNSIFHGNKTDLVSVPAASVSTTCFGSVSGAGAPKHGLNGNLKADPRFRAAGDPSLSPFSPAIDAARYTAQVDPTTDLYGHARTADGDGNAVHAPDLGAVEYLPLRDSSGLAPIPGGVTLLSLDLPSNASLPYALGLAFSDTGIPLPGNRRLALWPDPLFAMVVKGELPLVRDFTGLTNTSGFARARIMWPNDQRLKGFTFFCAGITVQAGYPGSIRCVTNGLALTLK